MNPIQKAEMLPVEEYLQYIKECVDKQIWIYNPDIIWPIHNTSVSMSNTIKVPKAGFTRYSTRTSAFHGFRKLTTKYSDYKIIDKYSYHWLKDKKYNSKFWPNLEFDFFAPWVETTGTVIIDSVKPELVFTIEVGHELVDSNEFNRIHRFKRYRILNEVTKHVYYLRVTHGNFKSMYPLNSNQLQTWVDITRAYNQAVEKINETNRKLEVESHAITLLNKLKIK